MHCKQATNQCEIQLEGDNINDFIGRPCRDPERYRKKRQIFIVVYLTYGQRVEYTRIISILADFEFGKIGFDVQSICLVVLISILKYALYFVILQPKLLSFALLRI